MGFLKLVLLCSFMFAASMSVGCLPLVFSLSHRHLRTLTTFGVGLLIGTAFIVIIPEGIHTLYAAPASQHQQHAHSHTTDTAAAAGVMDADYWQRWWQGGSPVDSLDALDDREHGTALTHSPTPATPVRPHILRHDSTEDEAEANERHGQQSSAALSAATAIVHIVPATRSQGEAGGRSLMQQHSAHQHSGDEEEAEGEHAAGAASERIAVGAEGESDCVFEPEGSGYIGASLALGFVVMLIVDRLSGGHSHGPPPPHPDGASHSGSSEWQLTAPSKRSTAGGRRAVADSLHIGSSDRTDDDDDMYDVVQRTSIIHIAAANTHSHEATREKEMTAEERDREKERQRVEREKERERAHGYAPYAASGALPSSDDPSAALSSSAPSSSATIGILVHSFVDGLALGAISVSSDSSLEMVVFLAILLHKGPAALGLVSFLMYQGRSQLYIRTQLTVFSLCAPIAALLTFALLSSPLPWASAAGSTSSATSQSAVGLMLLFSGGTFLFTIAVHIMPTIRQTNTAHSHSHSHAHSHDRSHSHSHRHHGPGGGSGGSNASSAEHAASLLLSSPGGLRQQQQDDDRDSELGLLLSKHHRSEEQQIGGEEQAEPLEWRYVIVLILGILSPGLTSFGHSHAHG